MKSLFHHMKWAFIVTAGGLLACFWLGWHFDGTLAGALKFLFLGSVLAVLEISLSFDNAIVNANKLKSMGEVWRRRFLTWGILIAVFGMRIVFPLVVVAVAACVGPIDAITLAATDPATYSRLMSENHLAIAAFGGTFLMMVALSFFIDHEKEIHWLDGIENRLRRMSAIHGVAYGLVLLIVLAFGVLLPPEKQVMFFRSAILGLVVFLLVDALSHVLDEDTKLRDAARQGGLGAFLYLEVLDASFSFDGVIGAFALTQNLFLIAIGLGIGAMYVRSMTIMLVEKRTLNRFRFLEHGAFYSIFSLALVMFGQSFMHIPEVVTGLAGASIIGISLYASIRHNRQYAT